MVTKVVGDVYSSDVNIIYNAVSVDRKNPIFSKKVQLLHPGVYEEYLDEINSIPRTKIGEIQLVETVNRKQFIFNGFIWDVKRKLNMIAFVKTLVELCNLSEEYHVSVGFPKNMIESKVWSEKIIYQVIEEVFRDSEVNAYIFS